MAGLTELYCGGAVLAGFLAQDAGLVTLADTTQGEWCKLPNYLSKTDWWRLTAADLRHTGMQK